MKRIMLIFKRGRTEARCMAESLAAWMTKRGLDVVLRQNRTSNSTDPREGGGSFWPSQPVDAVVVLGGDGTFLSVARCIDQQPVPMIGVNLGGLGFLTEVGTHRCFQELERILDGGYEIERRMRLTVEVRREKEQIFRQTVLNDVVINKGALARIVDFNTHIDGRFLTHYRADGLIVATPTGSTAYNLSAGGPIVHPVVEVIIVTPICPFTLTNRPIILPADATVNVELDPRAQDVALTCDGQVGCRLHARDHVAICRDPHPLHLIKPIETDYFSILRTKLKWGQH